jgi:glutathione peroxidase
MPDPVNVYALSAPGLDGAPIDLGRFRGKVTLVVNVASECGFTPQYAGLQQLHAEHASAGFAVLGFPSNEFGAQEPGSPEQIRTFCTTKYGVGFPLFAKVQTKAGPGQSPVYAALERATGKLPSWNFGKYLVDRNGRPLAFHPSKTAPDDPALRAAIAAALAAG